MEYSSRGGGVYVSVNESRTPLLFRSMASLRRHGVPFHVISSTPVTGSFTWVGRCAAPGAGFWKTQALSLSPFESTLLLDARLRLRRPLPPIDDVLGDAEMALPRDVQLPTAAALACDPARGRLCCAEEHDLSKALASRSPDAPYLDTWAVFFRPTDSVRRLFATWQEEWHRFEGHDQPALARALARAPVKLRVLPPEFGRPGGSDPGGGYFESSESGVLESATPGDAVHDAFRQATHSGLCTLEQYEALGRLIVNLRPLNLLVFGCGADSNLWNALNARGRTRFIESDRVYASRVASVGHEVVHHEFPTVRGRSSSDEAARLPSFMEGVAWDLVFVDGPPGHSHEQPGRELPIRWAAQASGSPCVAVHDYDRIWERTCCRRHLGPPDAWVPGSAGRPNDLALWLKGRVAPAALAPR